MSTPIEQNTTALEELLETAESLPNSTGAGENGATFMPSVASDGTLSWTNDKGLPNPDPVNIKGPAGPAGTTPRRGTDYWTPTDKEEIATEAAADVLAEVQSTAIQQTALFANSIEECTDTSKVYVLPDGYIYAYMSVTGPLHTNLLSTAIGADGEPYNGGLGYKKGWRMGTAVPGKVFDGSDGFANDNPNGILTGMIAYNPNTVKTIRISGCTSNLNNLCSMVFFDGSYVAIANQHIQMETYVNQYAQTYANEPAFDTSVKTFTFDIDAFATKTSWYVTELKNNAKYVAFSIRDTDVSKLVITFDEEIAFGTTTKWVNTGHQIVPADCEYRIIPLEKTTQDHEERIHTLEMYGSGSTSADDIPAYIKTEADATMNRLINKQGNRNFTMVAISDIHYGGTGDNKDNLIRACKAISYMADRMHIDAIATLGDNLPYGESYDDNIRATADRWCKEINEILAVTQRPGIVDFRTCGNHDRFGTLELFMPDNAIYSFIGGYNRQCDYVNAPIGYAYKDFNSYNLRVIVLNTAESEGKGRFEIHSGYHMSTKQYKWLIDTLDLSDKPNAPEWQIVVLSHHRADDYQVYALNTESYILPNILHAYNTGGSFSGVNAEDGVTIACNFAGKNSAKLIGQIHGHHHSYIYGTLGLGRSYNELTGQTNVMAVSTPTSALGTGSSHNDDNDGNYYDSVKDTADETAFCVYSIDLDNHVIHAIHYGNGIDREINY